jgi:hypothetical protein
MSTSHLREIADAYGFALQLALEDAVRRSKTSWEVISREHGWLDDRDPKFVDLILNQGGPTILVVECKRTKGGDWIFLVPNLDGLQNIATRAMQIESVETAGKIEGSSSLDTYGVGPPCWESAFCAVRGAGERDRPMLDRICAELTRATDAISTQQMAINQSLNHLMPGHRLENVLIPVVVTTARLHVCRFNPGKVSLESGEIPEDGSVFEDVTHLRYRKSFDAPSVRAAGPDRTTTLGELERHAQRTVLIVRANYFQQWLREFRIEPASVFQFRTGLT